MDSTKYAGMDVHKERISVAVMNAAGEGGVGVDPHQRDSGRPFGRGGSRASGFGGRRSRLCTACFRVPTAD
jgi:hypothetical protein